MNHPVAKGLFFAAVLLVFQRLGWLNYVQAGTIGAVGFFILTSLFYWQALVAGHRQREALVSFLIVLFTLALFFFASFQMALRDIFHVQQDNVVVIESIFNTNAAESGEFLRQYGRYLIKHLLIFVVVTAGYFYLTRRKWHPSGAGRKTVIACCVFTVVTLLLHLNPTVRRTNPLLYVPIYYAKWTEDLENTHKLLSQLERNKAFDMTAAHYRGGSERNTVIWVIGESDTRHNWSLYGYPRRTTPRLEQHPELLAFTNVRAADAGTIISMTKMLTPATLAQPDLWKRQPSILALAKAAGYKVFWISNQGTDRRGVMSVFATQADVIVMTNRGTSRGESSFDEVLFAPYEQALRDPAKKKLIIAHLMGAHPAYDFRYPESWEKYTMATDDSVARELRARGRALHAIVLRNQYDNAIRYQDHVIATLLEKAQQAANGPMAWLYIADHGEDVAHHSNFAGHNHRVAEMWEVPMLFWASPEYDVNVPSPDVAYQADYIDHTLLGLLKLESPYHDLAADLFSASRTRLAATVARQPSPQ